jgi:hypothetical protein
MNKLNEQLNKIIKLNNKLNEASIDTPDTWSKLNNVRGRNVLIGSDGTLTITNNQNKPIKLKFSGKVSFMSIGINVGRIDEVGDQLLITTKESKRKTTLNQNHVNSLINFIDNPKLTNITFDNVAVQEPNSNQQKTGTILAQKV